MCVMLIAVNAAVLDLMLAFFWPWCTMEPQRPGGFSVFYMSFLLFSFFFADGVAWYVCLCGAGEGKKKKKRASRWIWVAAVTKTRFPGLLFVCSQPIGGQRLSPTIHSCKKTGNVGKPWWLWRGLREKDRERENHTREKEREGGPYWILCLFALPSACSGHSVALWGHLCAFCSQMTTLLWKVLAEAAIWHFIAQKRL